MRRPPTVETGQTLAGLSERAAGEGIPVSSATSVGDLAAEQPSRPPHGGPVLAVLCVSLLIVSLDNTILNVALPVMVRAMHASSTQLQWIVDAYAIVFAGLLLVGGSIGDRLGRKWVLVAA